LQAGKQGGTYPAVLCAADEVAVELFLAGALRFTAIPALIEIALSRHTGTANPDLEEILAADAWARALSLEEARMLA
jgi:1-deoxy-D-xylulose-5-phosphate reductoisomerase